MLYNKISHVCISLELCLQLGGEERRGGASADSTEFTYCTVACEAQYGVYVRAVDTVSRRSSAIKIVSNS
jgi:hypothetical protein